ncbi:hypothetical protein RND81_05G272500 [Saponaria officinalis]
MAEEQHTAGYYLVMGTMTPEDTITAVDLVGGWESLEIKVQFRCLGRKCRGYRKDHIGTLVPNAPNADPLGLGHVATLQYRCSYCQTRWASVTVVRFHPAHQFVRGEFYDQDGVPVRAFDVVQRHHQMIVRTDADPVGTWRVTRAH